MLIPNNITIKPREQMRATSEGSPQAYLGSASLYLDMTCAFMTVDRREREALNAVSRPWIQYDWLEKIGLSAFVAKRVAQSENTFSGRLSNTRFAANASSAFELQTAQDELPSCDGHTPNQWPTTGKLGRGPAINTITLNTVNNYTDFKYDSGRIERQQMMLGKMAEFKATINHITPAEFSSFVLWYRCQMFAGSNKFNADWLVHREIGAWSANFSEPWEATFNRGRWSLSLSLMLVEDAGNEAWGLWQLEDAAIDGEAMLKHFCPSTQRAFAPLLAKELDRAELNINAFCEITNNLGCLNND